jgi:hypothetical protein
VIAKIDPSISKTALVQEIQLYAYVAGQHPNASAKQSRHDEQMILVDEPGPDRVAGEGRTGHRNIEAIAPSSSGPPAGGIPAPNASSV